MERTWRARVGQAAGVVQAGVGRTGRHGAGGRAGMGAEPPCGFRRRLVEVGGLPACVGLCCCTGCGLLQQSKSGAIGPSQHCNWPVAALFLWRNWPVAALQLARRSMAIGPSQDCIAKGNDGRTLQDTADLLQRPRVKRLSSFYTVDVPRPSISPYGQK